MKSLVLFAIDNNYVPHLATALCSFIETHDILNYEVGLIYSNIDDNKIEKFVDFFCSNGLVILPHKINSNEFDRYSIGHHFSVAIFYRFLAPEIFSLYEKILYIDSDIIFLDDISDIFTIDLRNKVLAAVDRTPFFGVPSHLDRLLSRYFASGLMLINTKEFVSRKIKERCVDFLQSHKYEMPDQDALSFVVQDFVSIDPSYSVETVFLGRNEKIYDFAKSPKIVQFSGSSKPWHMNNRHPYKKLYWYYRNQTPYKSYLPDDFGLLNLARYITPDIARTIMKKIIGMKKS